MNSEAQIKHQILIVGGGTAGITVAARLRRAAPHLEVAVIEPSDSHYYQPLWTLVGAGIVRKEKTRRTEASVIPPGVTWIKEAVSTFVPEENRVTTRDGRSIAYDYLIVAPGIQLNWSAIKGLPEGLGSGGIVSNYEYRTADSTWEAIRSFRGGTALFTMPNTPVKCGGAPQKIMYLAEDYFRRHGLRDQSRVVFASAGAKIFSVAKYTPVLEEIVRERQIETLFRHNLIEIRADEKKAVFQHLDTGDNVIVPYDMIHVTPPMSAPDFVRQSPLADAQGWVDVDRFTLQHTRFPNVFGIGDASSLPTSKTGAGVRKQAPVLVKNLLAAIQGKDLKARYNGYTSCPLVTGYGKLVLAEFDYEGKPAETFPFNQAKERLSMYLLKRHLLPLLYWHGMLKGRA